MEFSTLLILMVVIWTAGKIFRYLKLPVVFGELLGGILVGPVLLGLVPADSEMIKVLAELGIFFLMLHSGLESDPKEFIRSSKKSLLIATGGVILPFLGGFLITRHFGYNAVTAFFVGMGMSTSAIAITARLLKDCGLTKTRVGHLAIGSAIIDDIMALVLFSIALSLAENGNVELIPLLWLIVKITIFFAVVIYGGMRISSFMNRIIYWKNKGFTLTLIIALLMGLIAEAIGLHMVIGAFTAGLLIREEVIDTQVFKKIEDRIYGLSYSFFGPIFFASLAFHLDFSAFTGAPYFMLSIFVIAILGKIIGAGGMAYLLKIKPLESFAIGLTMNNRGAVELIIASIGLSMGIIDANIFSILILMAFVTTTFSILTMSSVAKKLKEN